MAVRYAPHVAFNWSDAVWSAADDNAQDQAAAGAGDIAAFTANSGDCTLTANVDDLQQLYMVGYPNGKTLALGTYYIDVDGTCHLDGTITASAGGKIYCSTGLGKTAAMADLGDNVAIECDGTGFISCSSVGGGDLIINAGGGSVEASDAGLWASFTLTAGTYTDSANAHTIAGKIAINANMTSTAAWTMSASGTLNAGTSARDIYELTIPTGVTCSVAGTTYLGKLDCQAGSTLVAGTRTIIILAHGSDYCQMDGTITTAPAILNLYSGSDAYTNSGHVEATTLKWYSQSASRNLTHNGTITAGSLNIYNNTDGAYTNLILGASATGSDLGAVGLGHASDADRDARLDLGDNAIAVTMTSLATRVATQENQVDFGDATVTLSGTIDGTDITCTTAVVAPAKLPSIVGGTVSNVTWTGTVPLDCSGDYTIDGGGNTGEVWFGSGISGNYNEARRERQWGEAAGTRR